MSHEPELEPRLRVSCDKRHLFGPGKAELLRLIAATGSILEAARQMDMSYQRAWTLVRELNSDFREPLVAKVRGGGTGGGAALTPAGEAALAAYERMTDAALAAVRTDWQAFRRQLR